VSYWLGLQPLLDEVLLVLAVPLAGGGGGVLRIWGPLGCHVHPASTQNHLSWRWNSIGFKIQELILSHTHTAYAVK